MRVGADVDGLVSRQERGVTPLMAAAQGGHVEAVATLLAADAAINLATPAQATAVHLAAGGEQPAALALLLRARAALHARDLNKWGAAARGVPRPRARARAAAERG